TVCGPFRQSPQRFSPDPQKRPPPAELARIEALRLPADEPVEQGDRATREYFRAGCRNQPVPVAEKIEDPYGNQPVRFFDGVACGGKERGARVRGALGRVGRARRGARARGGREAVGRETVWVARWGALGSQIL